jgi:hypothetical protein
MIMKALRKTRPFALIPVQGLRLGFLRHGL